MTSSTDIADQMAAAASQLLDSLDPGQRAAATWPFPAEEERTLWFYTPTDHGGLPLLAMTPGQHQLAHRLLATALSPAGYVTAAAIMGLENILDHTEGWRTTFGRERGRDPLAYWVAIFGQPADGGTWAWRFGGHHLSVNITIAKGEVVSTTPLFFGADPAATPLLGPHLHRPLAGAEDLGRELIRSLTEAQAARAVVSSVAPADLVTANRTELSDGDRTIPLPDIWRGRLEDSLHEAMATAQEMAVSRLGYTEVNDKALAFTTVPKGLPAAELSGEQRQILTALLDVYLQRIPDVLADEAQARVRDQLNELCFVWAGGSERGQPHYYRLQSSDTLIEYDNTQRDVNHVHTVWRDLRSDFGRDALAEHYTSNKHHR